MLFSKDEVDVRISESQGNLCIYLHSPGYAYAAEEVEREDLSQQDQDDEEEMDADEIKEKIQQLKSMYADGLISEEEYNTKRKELIDRL